MSTSTELCEKVARLEVTSEQHTKDIETLKSISGVVSELSNNMNKLSETVNTVNESVKMMAETTKELKQAQHDEELLKKHSICNHVFELIKKVSIKEWITFIIFIAGVITALVKLV